MASADAPDSIPDVVGLRTADLVDAMGRLHRHRCSILDLVSPDSTRVLFGPAVTISYFPTCEQALPSAEYNLARLFYDAIAGGPEGRVLVLASNGHPDESLGGGTKLSRVANHGMEGILADGRLRDFDELGGHDIATWCRGEAVRWGGDVITPFEANRPVVIDRVGIRPGDFVFADSSGAVVIPARQVHEVVAEARVVVDSDAAFTDQIRTEVRSTAGDDER
jgi:4-hydroxy-4-methyl-2-oxoglutarate aldolase